MITIKFLCKYGEESTQEYESRVNTYLSALSGYDYKDVSIRPISDNSIIIFVDEANISPNTPKIKKVTGFSKS